MKKWAKAEDRPQAAEMIAEAISHDL
jgi:hypothetical protein